MKKSILFLAILVCSAFSFAQNNTSSVGRSISKFEKGKVLSEDDVNFMYVVTKKEKARGATSVNVDGLELTVGSTLDEVNAKKINEKVDSYLKDKQNGAVLISNSTGEVKGALKEMSKTRSGAMCWYWYCDGWGNCWKVWYACGYYYY